MARPKFLEKSHIHLGRNVAFSLSFYLNDVYEPELAFLGSD
jgi:hypothetical protein